MLTKPQVELAIVALQSALEYNVSALLSAHLAGQSSVHRVLSQAPSLSFTLTALSQLQELQADMEVLEAEAEQQRAGATEPAEVEVENPFARRMREARERKAKQKSKR